MKKKPLFPPMDGTAVIFTHGFLDSQSAKTAHGLIRGTERYQVLGVIDHVSAGKDAGEVIDGKNRSIPIFPSLADFINQTNSKPDFFIIGIANAGGKIPQDWKPLIEEALKNGISIVSGMHEFLSDNPKMLKLAQENGAQLIDVRKPLDRQELHFWTGEIHEVTCPIIAVLGVDCAVGKRTTARFLVEACRKEGLNAQMIYTGQTGWMQGGKYGFIFDSTVNDFVSGELEHAIVTCFKAENPDFIFIEGQAALRNPSGPCGSEMLVSGKADGVILVYPEGREYYKGWESTGRKLPTIANEIALVNMYNVPTLAVALNTQRITTKEAFQKKQEYEKELGIPVALPLEEGVQGLVSVLSAFKNSR